MTRLKRPHFVPQGYLRGFTNQKGQIFVLDKKYWTIQPQSPKGTGIIKDFYLDPKMISLLDVKEVTQLEGQSIQIIKRLENQNLPSPAEVGQLLNFISLQLLRTPAAKKRAEESFTEFLRGIRKEYLKRRGLSISTDGIEKITAGLLLELDLKISATEFLLSENIPAPPKSFFLDILTHLGWPITKQLSEQGLKFLYCEEGNFITSDDPACLFGGKLISINSNRSKIIPLSKNVSLEIQGQRGLAMETLKPWVVKIINLAFIDSCNRFVYATHKDHLETLKQKYMILLKDSERGIIHEDVAFFKEL